MPELGEILAIHRLLCRDLSGGARFTFLVQGQKEEEEAPFTALLAQDDDGIVCKGKVLAFKLGDGHMLMMHLMLHGQLSLEPTTTTKGDEEGGDTPTTTVFSCLVQDETADHTVRRRRLVLQDKGECVLAWAKCVSAKEGLEYLHALAPSLHQLGKMDFCRALASAAHRRRNIETVLVDQHALVSGIGQWLRAHMLAAAGLSGKEKTGRITRTQAEFLYDRGVQLVEALVEALTDEKNASTLANVYTHSKALRPALGRSK